MNNDVQNHPKRSIVKKTPPIVAIGASAGGLEALQAFLKNIPEDSGLSIVVIQHLDPHYKGLLTELLQRVTAMKVVQIRNRMKVKPGHVYVIPPNKDLSIRQGTLYLFELASLGGLHLPIDFFFRSLAEDQKERATGVIMSGMGSDGTLGLRAIKEKAGLAAIQEPGSAKFDSMPRSAIDAGLADIIAPADELAQRIITYLKQNQYTAKITEPFIESDTPSGLEKILILLRNHAGNDFSFYKKTTLYRRIERRMSLHQISTLDNYARFLLTSSQELNLLFKELLIGVTNFFRDPEAWDKLKLEILPHMLSTHPKGTEFRAWVPACSTGEEAYSLAMVFMEVLAQAKLQSHYRLQIFATDLDRDAIKRARVGIFPKNIIADVSPDRLDRFFVLLDGTAGYQVKKNIREMIIFARQNVFTDPPFTRLDILSCRNLLIYLDPDSQQKLIALFHYALVDNGILLLGSSETTGSSTLFSEIGRNARLYKRLDSPPFMLYKDFPVRLPGLANGKQQETSKINPSKFNLQTHVEHLLLQGYAPAAVLINKDGDILYINGHTGNYLEPAAGKANWNIYAMAHKDLRHALPVAIKKALSNNKVTLEGLKMGSQQINLIVQAIEAPNALQGHLLVIFKNIPSTSEHKCTEIDSDEIQKILMDEVNHLRAENQDIKEEMQSSEEELKSANEELQSTNEELQSTNEELQSSNEELTSSKEELQSLNEELQVVNSELQSKVDELSSIHNDMKNLLDSTEIATVFLDNHLHVRRFTTNTTATELFKLIPGDVGRPLSDIASLLDYPQLTQDTEKVLRTLVFIEKQVSSLHNHRIYKVRIMPYRTQENFIDGIVMTFSDITDYVSEDKPSSVPEHNNAKPKT